jgi:hypothetical protein
MSEPEPDNTFRERWDRAAEKLRRENSLDGFLQMHEDGDVSWVELFNFAYEHWYECPEPRAQFLSSLARHESEEIRDIARDLTAFIAKHHPGLLG